MKILLVDDDTMILKALSQFLERQLFHDVTQCTNGREAIDILNNEPFPLVISDIRMPGMDGLELLDRIKKIPSCKTTDVVMITSHGSMSTAVQALRAGAYDYLQKPPDVEELAAIILKIEEHQSLLHENLEFKHQFEEKLNEATEVTEIKLKELQHAYAEVVGIGRIGVFSGKMRAVLDITKKLNQDRSVPVLIEGETGTGKEVISRLVHYGDRVDTSPFISINCSAIAGNLFESELFGYEGGAFSDAKKTGMMGKFEFANGGTLFLDEIGDLPLDLQPKLLRAIQEREIYRVGGLKKIKLDVRIICASNKNLDQLVKDGLFRQDLFYRLNLGRILLPPLRERPEEILPLAKMFLDRFVEIKKSRFREFSGSTVSILNRHNWPGNVRELENAIERVVLLYDDTTVRPEHVGFLENDDVETNERTVEAPNEVMIKLPEDSYSLEKGEMAIIKKALEMFDGNKTKTASYFGVSLSTLKRKAGRIID